MRVSVFALMVLVASACGVDLAEIDEGNADLATADSELTSALAVAPRATTLQPGGSATANITLSTTGTWTLSLSSLSNGVSARLSSPTLASGQPVTLTLTAGATEGVQSFTLTAKSGAKRKTFTGSVTVAAARSGGSQPHVFVIAMENKSSTSIYGNANAPYLNSLKGQYGSAANYRDVLGSSVPSEPHYVWMEAGTNVFDDHTFTGDGDATATNSTADTNHFVSKLTTGTWRTYQEGMTAGTCPIHSIASTFYAAKHDPFVFFQDVAGAPVSAGNPGCIAHHRPFSDFSADLSGSDVANYTFITPNLCHDMHGAAGCNNACTSGGSAGCIAAGDDWLRSNVPAILSFITGRGGVLLIVFDEPEGTGTQPFFIAGPHLKPGFSSGVTYTHSSYLKTLERLFALPVDPRVSAANDFSDFFAGGVLP